MLYLNGFDLSTNTFVEETLIPPEHHARAKELANIDPDDLYVIDPYEITYDAASLIVALFPEECVTINPDLVYSVTGCSPNEYSE